MAMTTEFRITTLEWLRKSIGDEDKLCFTDQELDIILRSYAYGHEITENIGGGKNYFYSQTPQPVIDMEVETAGANHWRVDEVSKMVEFVSGTMTPPTNETQIEISYVNVDFTKALIKTLTILANDKSKLAIKVGADGEFTDMTQAYKAIMQQCINLTSQDYFNSW